MPTATVSGAILGLAYELHSNSVRKRRFGVGRCMLTMVAGAVVARMVSNSDKKAQASRERETQAASLTTVRIKKTPPQP